MRRRPGRSTAAKDQEEVTVSLLGPHDERQEHCENLLDPGHRGPRPAAHPFEQVVQLLSSGINTAASSVGACVHWVLGSRTRQQLGRDDLARLESVRNLLRDKFDPDNAMHQEALDQLWRACFTSESPPVGPSPKWVEAGFQSCDPARDFRGGGVFSLLNLLYMAQHHQRTFQRLLSKSDGHRSEWEYPFSAAGINITFKLEQLLNLRDMKGAAMHSVAATPATCAFARLLADTNSAFEELYVAAFEVLDRRWLAAQASYMQFPAVLDGTMSDLKRVLHTKPSTVQEFREALGL